MREKYEAMGNEMIRNLGFENKKVILFWKAFEEEHSSNSNCRKCD